MGYGKYHPYPRRFGGNKHAGQPLTEVLHESLNAQRSVVFETENTVASLEHLAWARALAYDGWEVNHRLSLQWDPMRTTDMLQRWEQIFAIRPAPNATEKSRRVELARRWARFGRTANHATLESELRDRLGDFFYGIEYLDPSLAVVHSPDASYPWGTQVDGVPWYSTVGLILVRLQKPANTSESDFYRVAGQCVTALDPLVNSFVSFVWYRAPESTPINVAGGPSAGGFYLDDEHNLDNNVFDV